jgi:hypothetical protein
MILFSSLFTSTHTSVPDEVNFLFVYLYRYLVSPLMGADLNNIIKTQTLSDDHVQFLVYQILRGLKVSGQILCSLAT